MPPLLRRFKRMPAFRRRPLTKVWLPSSRILSLEHPCLLACLHTVYRLVCHEAQTVTILLGASTKHTPTRVSGDTLCHTHTPTHNHAHAHTTTHTHDRFRRPVFPALSMLLARSGTWRPARQEVDVRRALVPAGEGPGNRAGKGEEGAGKWGRRRAFQGPYDRSDSLCCTCVRVVDNWVTRGRPAHHVPLCVDVCSSPVRADHLPVAPARHTLVGHRGVVLVREEHR